MTFFSLALAGVFIAVFKSKNPEMNVRPILTMFGAVALGCAIMTLISQRKKNNDQER
jgi:branched-subunit amino acid ABC-type transport system permease component